MKEYIEVNPWGESMRDYELPSRPSGVPPHEYYEGTIARARDLLDRKDKQNNPLAEILNFLLGRSLMAHGRDFWEWFENPRHLNQEWFHDNPNEKMSYARLEVNCFEDNFDYTYHNNPWQRSSGLNGVIQAGVRGHGDGRAFTQSFFKHFSPLTIDFITIISPLIRAMSYRGEDLLLNLGYTKRQGSALAPEFEISGVSLKIGHLEMYHTFRPRNPFEHQCRNFGLSVINIRNTALDIENSRPAMFVCSNGELMFYVDEDPKLKQMMLGDKPTEDEMMMIEMAGYKKEEFWLDNIRSFDKMRIKSFNLREYAECYQKRSQYFRF